MKKLLAALAVALLAGCAGAADGPATGTDGDTIKIGVVGASDPYWEVYTGGEQQMLAITRAAILGPSVIVLDEPTEGLAPSVVELVGELILRLQAQGVATLLMEQHGVFPLTVADRVLTIDRGVVRASAESEPATGRLAATGAIPASGPQGEKGQA